MKQLTLSIATKTLLGLDPRGEGEATRRMFEQWIHLALAIPTILLQFNLPGLPYHRVLTLSSRLQGEVKALIARKREGGVDTGDVLSMLLEAHDEDGARLSDADVIAQTATLFVAGHETTAAALTWTLFLLAQHPAVMADLLDEVQSVLHGDAPSIHQLPQLPLLEAVIKESMRLLPPFIWGMRIAAGPSQLGAYHLPKGTTVVWSAPVTHRMPELFPNPNRFDPARWQNLALTIYDYLPFGAGPRLCLGATFAMTEMKVVLPIVLQRYRLALSPGASVNRGGLVLSAPKKGMPVTITHQDRRFTRDVVRGNIRAMVDLPE